MRRIQRGEVFTLQRSEALLTRPKFVRVHQALLATVIGKHGILASTPFTQPIAQVLQVIEGGVDTLAFDIIDLVPTCAAETTDNKNAVDQSLIDAVNTYSS